ncbi:polyisoprenoid-binding protein YceI [Dyadobacter jejuensis]|uniref:Polyisoprenoid-binding protein YceI n=1 Tax=Dyadobacter jejuensis TaxID=1082580 RepID=A0A316AMI4_9BACT|nr:YceI family protein [Dyadobacter jejuensis]PWJ58786.1 polyisoprenoid-binding protein YceI [Dyadobacter jejuensis]
MKKIALSMMVLCAMVAFNTATAQVIKPVADGSKLAFNIKNLGITTTGYFKQIEGTINFSPASLTTASFDVYIPTASIDTDNNLRDSHLKKEEYFDVTKYPKMHFVSTKVSQTSAGKYVMIGNLSIKDVTKTVSIPFTVKEQSGGYLFTGELPLNRRSYHVGGRSFTLSDDLTISLKVLAK